MPARRSFRFPIAGILFLALTHPQAVARVEPDPHDLYEAARDHLKNGELGQAELELSRLRSLISHGSHWDPGGVFANELLPPLVAKLRRMQVVTRELDAFSARAIEDLKPPEVTDDVATLRHYTDWAASAIQRLRKDRDHIIAAELKDPEEQAALTRTASYARTEQLLETGVLRSMADSNDSELLGLVSGDPRIAPVLVRFRQLKRDLMRIMVERNQLGQQLRESRESNQAHLQALAALVTDSVPADFQGGKSQRIAVADLFLQFLDRQLEAARLQTSQTSAERDARRAALNGYQRRNEILTKAGVGTDQSSRIQALAKAVEHIRVDDGGLVTPSTAGWVYGLLTSALVLIAGFSSWLAVVRGRRLSAARRMSELLGPVHDAKFPRNVGGNAA